MALRYELSSSLNRFRSISVNHPLAFKWEKGVMTYYQLGKKWNMSKLFLSCYMPKYAKGIILPSDIKKLLIMENNLAGYDDNVIIVPKDFGFDIMKPSGSGPIVIDEIRFYSIKNRLVMHFMKWIPSFKGLLTMVNKEFDR